MAVGTFLQLQLLTSRAIYPTHVHEILSCITLSFLLELCQRLSLLSLPKGCGGKGGEEGVRLKLQRTAFQLS